ncbi:MAG: tRNA pseudouridine(13) synthase TruD [Methanoregulaceae archaeon]|nr:tRNA pseudouridine(13) synthase TruD [Methanoregulaceae archaeon]
MRKSPYPVEQELGMRCYTTDTAGIGGRLRTTAEDFVVDEVPCDIGGTGPYLVCRLTKKDWELQRAVKELAKRFGISHRRISWSGTKDKHAVTSQLISLYEVTGEQVAAIDMKDISLEVIGRAEKPLSLGSLRQNRFTIVIREVSGPDLAGQVATVTAAAAEGLPNYFGIQRFGVIRPITHLVGEHILRGEYEEAVMVYTGRAYQGETPDVRAAREAFSETRDTGVALHAFPVPLRYERALIHHLHTNPGDYAGALQSLPPRLLSMFVSAFQSFLFNHAVSSRLERGLLLSEPAPGDRLVFADGREEIVDPRNIQAARLHTGRGRCRIALHMPGSDWKEASGPDEAAMHAVLSERGITAESFRSASSFVRATYAGAHRPIALQANVDAVIDGNTVRISFPLAPGQYATTVCREYMKADPVMMI